MSAMVKPGTRLAEQLRREADRRHKMGDHEVAHDLRRLAMNASSAQMALDGSKEVLQQRNMGMSV